MHLSAAAFMQIRPQWTLLVGWLWTLTVIGIVVLSGRRQGVGRTVTGDGRLPVHDHQDSSPASTSGASPLLTARIETLYFEDIQPG